jgi:hypothetical protein
VLPLVAALLALIGVAGCKTTSPSVAPRLILPPLDSEATTPCPDPGINANARIALVEHRKALAICEERRALAVTAYEAALATASSE